MHRGVCRRGGRQRQPDRVSACIAPFDFGLPGGTPQAGHHRARDRYRRSTPRADDRDRRARRAGQPALQRGRDASITRMHKRTSPPLSGASRDCSMDDIIGYDQCAVGRRQRLLRGRAVGRLLPGLRELRGRQLRPALAARPQAGLRRLRHVRWSPHRQPEVQGLPRPPWLRAP